MKSQAGGAGEAGVPSSEAQRPSKKVEIPSSEAQRPNYELRITNYKGRSLTQLTLHPGQLAD